MGIEFVYLQKNHPSRISLQTDQDTQTIMIQLHQKASHQLIQDLQSLIQKTNTDFDSAQQIVPYLGAQALPNGRTQVGFWTPQIVNNTKEVTKIYLEIYTPLQQIDFANQHQQVDFRIDKVALLPFADYYFGIIQGMKAGNKNEIGSFYTLKYETKDGKTHQITDYLTQSTPFGIFAPAELYDWDSLQANRKDKAYFQEQLQGKSEEDGILRIAPPKNILQVHVGTASESGTLQGLTNIFQKIAHKTVHNEPLSTVEKNFTNYDAIQLLPIEPVIEYEYYRTFWEENNRQGNKATITLRQFDIQNWGYDVVIAGDAAINPAYLATKRPDELLELIETLHAFPQKPIQLLLDVVYGHADNQADKLLSSEFIHGPGMYGKELNFSNPVVRAIMLETQRRKANFGIDGIRVDAAQDFKVWSEETQQLEYDSDYLHLMNDLVQEVGEVSYRPFFVFEDGRPWPKDDCVISANYLDVHNMMPNAFQWGPLTFVNNQPALYGFWLERFWRVKQIAEKGEFWVTGLSNHDTLRGGAQINPKIHINTYLGQSLTQIISNAYNNPAARLLDYGFLPGVPMEFIHSNVEVPWCFMRNTDWEYGVKVVAEESWFIDWWMNETRYQNPKHFQRMKKWGFHQLHQLRAFKHDLLKAVELTGYNLKNMIRILRISSQQHQDGYPVPGDEVQFRKWGIAYMKDAYDLCNIHHYVNNINATKTEFNHQLRHFRLQNEWLRYNLNTDDHIGYLENILGSVIYYGLRQNPKQSNKRLLFIANMEGRTITLNAKDLPLLTERIGESHQNWQVQIKTPDAIIDEKGITLANGTGVIFQL
ncbi:MAG: glucosylglycerol hydrolase [Chitinophagales bacterium]